MYTVYRLNTNVKSIESYFNLPACMDDIIVIIDTNGRDDESQTTVYYFLKSNDLYRIAGIKNVDFTLAYHNNKHATLVEEIRVSHRVKNSSLVELFKCNTSEEMETYALENNIVLFKPYECADISFKIDNKTDLPNSHIIDLIDDMNFEKITSIDVNTSLDSHGAISINDSNNFSYDRREKGIYVYATNDYYDWLNKHFAPELMHLFSGSYYMPTNEFYSGGTVFFVEATDMSISFHKLSIDMEHEKDCSKITIKQLFSGIYEIGKPVSCIKYLKKSNKSVSPFEMFNINSKNISYPHDRYVFNNAKNVYDFFVKNNVFFERSGLKRLIREMKSSMNVTAILLLYFSLIYEYPVIELLVKMGHCSLIEDVFNKLRNSGRKETIIENVDNLQQLINNDTTKGTMALRFPSFIGDYLKSKNAGLQEYLFWRDIYELKPLSKEHFDEFNDSIEKTLINASLSEKTDYYGVCVDWYSLGIQEIIKYPEYTLNKTIRYIFNQYINDAGAIFHNKRFKEYFGLLKDTLLFAEELDFQLEPYPENLIQIHDQIAKIRSEKIAKIKSEVVEKIAIDCDNYLKKVFSSESVDLPKKAMEKYTYIFPKTQQDFTQEGQNQHNCVAGYYSRVSKGDCIVFFVRNIDSPNESYITAEINNKMLNQVMFSNNRPVPQSSDEYKYCQFIARKILSAVEKNEILALRKITKRIK